MRLPTCTSLPSQRINPVPAETDRTKLTVMSTVVYAWPGCITECTAQPIAESSTVEIQPPCTLPIGLRKRDEGFASNTTRPCSTSVIQISVTSANGGAG